MENFFSESKENTYLFFKIHFLNKVSSIFCFQGILENKKIYYTLSVVLGACSKNLLKCPFYDILPLSRAKRIYLEKLYNIISSNTQTTALIVL